MEERKNIKELFVNINGTYEPLKFNWGIDVGLEQIKECYKTTLFLVPRLLTL